MQLHNKVENYNIHKILERNQTKFPRGGGVGSLYTLTLHEYTDKSAPRSHVISKNPSTRTRMPLPELLWSRR